MLVSPPQGRIYVIKRDYTLFDKKHRCDKAWLFSHGLPYQVDDVDSVILPIHSQSHKHLDKKDLRTIALPIGISPVFYVYMALLHTKP